jgi:putative ABC transport system permease protein
MFGIAWGVGSLLLLVGLGEGFRSGQRKSLAEVGTDFIWEWGGSVPAVGNQHTGMHRYALTLGDEEAIRTQAPHVRNATAIIQRNDLKQVSEFSSASGAAWGVQPNYPEIGNLPLAAGRFIDGDDNRLRRRVVVLGQKNAKLLFDERSPLGAFITINGSRFQVIGVAKKFGRGDDDGNNQKIYLPLGTMLEMFPFVWATNAGDAISSIQYQPVTDAESETAKAEVHRIVAERHGFDPANKDAFDEWDSIKTGQMIGVIFLGMDVFLGGVGLRKALGATNRSIMAQFMLEGLALTGFSGLIGMAGAAALMALLNAAMGGAMRGFDPPRLMPWSAALAVGSLTLCGVAAGLYPARQAAKLEPVEALRKD